MSAGPTPGAGIVVVKDTGEPWPRQPWAGDSPEGTLGYFDSAIYFPPFEHVLLTVSDREVLLWLYALPT